MKKIVLACFLSIVFSSCKQQKGNSYIKEIQQFQYEMNVKFSNKKDSPLTEEDLKTFKALDFFEINSTYKITADFKETPNAPIFEMPTTTERKPLYRKYGIAAFELEGKTHTLEIYQNQSLMLTDTYKDHLFIPFNDLTNGNESYGGGRYIDLEIPTKNSTTIVIDFNKAYNPYCAYNYKYSCPIPPKENKLNASIKAGVKAYKEH